MMMMDIEQASVMAASELNGGCHGGPFVPSDRQQKRWGGGELCLEGSRGVVGGEKILTLVIAYNVKYSICCRKALCESHSSMQSRYEGGV